MNIHVQCARELARTRFSLVYTAPCREQTDNATKQTKQEGLAVASITRDVVV